MWTRALSHSEWIGQKEVIVQLFMSYKIENFSLHIWLHQQYFDWLGFIRP